MEIDNVGFSPKDIPEVSAGEVPAGKESPSSESTRADSPVSSLPPDSVSLTDLSKTINEVLLSKDEPDPEREAFVRDLAERVRAGTYEVQVDKLVARFLGRI